MDSHNYNEPTIISCSSSDAQLPPEDDIMHDINHPAIYILKHLKRTDSTSAQAHRKNDRVYNNTNSCLFCEKKFRKMDRHVKTHKDFVTGDTPIKDIAKLRKQGDHENNTSVIHRKPGK